MTYIFAFVLGAAIAILGKAALTCLKALDCEKEDIEHCPRNAAGGIIVT